MGKAIILIGILLFIVGILLKNKESDEQKRIAKQEAEKQRRQAIEEKKAKEKAEKKASDAAKALAKSEFKAKGLQDHIEDLITSVGNLKDQIETIKSERSDYVDTKELEKKYQKLLDEAKDVKKSLENKISKLKEKLRSNVNEPNEPKAWHECAETLGLNGNDFTYDDVKDAYKKRAKEVTPNRVHGMDEEIVGLANLKATYVNLAHDYFKKYFNVK